MARPVLRNIGMAAERLRRNHDLDADGRLRPLAVVIHAGRRPWTAPGAAGRVAVDDHGEVLALLALPYAALDARRLTPEHLPRRNLVSTLFELNGPDAADAEAPLRALGGWLDELGERAAAVRAAYAEWLATVSPTAFPDGGGAGAGGATDRNRYTGRTGGRHGGLGVGGTAAAES